MRAPYISTAVLHRSWLVGVLAPLFLTGCAATRTAEGVPDTVDIGYGEVDQGHVDGSVETVEPEDEMAERTRTLADMLAEVPGVRVSVEGDNLAVRIRGSSSFLASEEPLLVVDGMQYRGGLRGINPFNIASITVLKNAGETAIYGARGANGVILIKTKRGEKSGGV